MNKVVEEAADIILSAMNPRLVDFFKERCRALDVEPWQVIAALVHRSCGLRALDYYLDPEEVKREVFCQNCGNVIPGAKQGQLYCCNKCSAYHQGSKVVQFGQHSEECPIVWQPWKHEA